MQQQIFSAREEQTTKANKSLYILRTLGKLDGYDRQSEIDLLFYTIVLPNINSPVSSSLWPLNDAFFTGLASIWNNKFTNSNEKKDLFITLSIVYIHISNTYLPEFLNILLYVEVNPVWMSKLFVFSGKF